MAMPLEAKAANGDDPASIGGADLQYDVSKDKLSGFRLGLAAVVAVGQRAG